MIAPREVPGKGLPWPQSIQAVVEFYGSYEQAAVAVGASHTAIWSWCSGQKLPAWGRTRAALAAYWGSEEELPHKGAPEVAVGEVLPLSYWTPEDHLRVAYFRARYRVWRMRNYTYDLSGLSSSLPKTRFSILIL